MSETLGIAGVAGLCCSPFGSIRTKADVMKFAIERTTDFTSDGAKVNYDEALKLFDFFCEHVNLTDTDVVQLTELADVVLTKIKDIVEETKKELKEERS